MSATDRSTTSLWVVLSTVGAAVLTAGAAVSSPQVLALAVGVLGGVLAWGWAGTLGLPTPRGTAGVIAAGSIALALAVGLADGEPWLSWVPAALSVGLILAFVHQVMRVDGRPRVVESLSAVVLALALVACGAVLVGEVRSPEGLGLGLGVLAAAAASAVVEPMDRLPRARAWVLPAAVLAGGLASSAVALALDAPTEIWLVAGVAAGAVSHAVRAVLAPLPTLVHARPRLVAGVASVLVVGAVPWLAAVAFLGRLQLA